MARTIKPALCERRLRIRRIAVVAVATTMIALLLINFAIRFIAGITGQEVLSSPWHYKCQSGFCKKTLVTENTSSPMSLGVCQMFCGEAGSLWPKPTGRVSLGNYVVQLDPENIQLMGADYTTKIGQLLYDNVEQLKTSLKKMAREPSPSRGYGLWINVPHEFSYKSERLALDAPEGYSLNIWQLNNGRIQAGIEAESYFGARNALETLSQLIVYDDLHKMLKIARDVSILKDEPRFPYRGLLLDTSRNFMDKASILRTIDAMAMSKLNTLHLHLTDSHSFPYVSKSLPKMSEYGAYTPDKVYGPEDIEEIVDYGVFKGIRVLPELDAPAHVGEGWQWVGHNATVCFNAQPWRNYCVEPPCGQLNPTSDKVYEILGAIYKDMLQDFKPDIFHMGGDEVNLNCWRSSEEIRDWMSRKSWNLTDANLYRLWDHFQKRAYEALKKANHNQDIPAILWTSELTSEENLKKLDPAKYIIQIWTTGNEPVIPRLIRSGFKVIFSNSDALYLDCGFGAWVGEGNNWCSPYKGWQKVYENSPMRLLALHNFDESIRPQVLGAEAALWAEQSDTSSMDNRLWPRSAAMAERLWSDPDTPWNQAEQRFLRHRERLVQAGIPADTIEPEWCLQNQGHCY